MSDNQPPDPPVPPPDRIEAASAEQGNPQPSTQPTPAPSSPIPPQVLAQLLAAAAARPSLGPGLLPISAGQLRVQAQVQWQGQYPPPEAIEHYEKVLPGAFTRMITMAEQLQSAQIAESKLVAEYTQRDNRRGHWLGFSAVILAMIAALAALALGYPWVAGAFISVPVMGVAKAL